MRLVLEQRAETGFGLRLLSPLLAVALALASAAVMFAALGADPLVALHAYFILPLSVPGGCRKWR